jgi:transcription elongation GreA/GreB family factor
MSRAFIKEVEPEAIELPDRSLSSHPNLVTAEGLAAIERTLSRFEEVNKAAIAKNDRAAIAATQRELRYWKARRSTATVIEPSADKSKVHFGATVTVRRDDGRTQTFRIVGEDEAEPHVPRRLRRVACNGSSLEPVIGRELLWLDRGVSPSFRSGSTALTMSELVARYIVRGHEIAARHVMVLARA